MGILNTVKAAILTLMFLVPSNLLTISFSTFSCEVKSQEETKVRYNFKSNVKMSLKAY
jgi:hypothetical protein